MKHMKTIPESLAVWLREQRIKGEVEPLTGDASFRTYYRLREHGGRSTIVMDASAQPETVAPFVEISRRLGEAGVRTPHIYTFDAVRGYLWMEDLGSRHMADLDWPAAAEVYRQAIDTIVRMQYASAEALPPYDRAFLLTEMALMQQWYLEKYLQISISPSMQSLLDEALRKIADIVLEQPQGCFVHRDFHSRNLMLDEAGVLVVIDFQDARRGAVTYDLVSLLRDVYVVLEPSEVERLALYFRQKQEIEADEATFLRWFDFMGLQRHIKIMGIFARLALRDGKTGYLKDLPSTFGYIMETAEKYEETRPLADLLARLHPEERR